MVQIRGKPAVEGLSDSDDEATWFFHLRYASDCKGERAALTCVP